MQTVNLDKLPPQARLELIDFYEFLLGKYASGDASAKKKFSGGFLPAEQPRLGDLAIKLFGKTAGINLDLPKHPPHEPLGM